MIRGFLLTQQSEQGLDGIDFSYWLSTALGPLCLRITGQEAVCFYERPLRVEVEQGLAGLSDWRVAPVELQSFNQLPVDALYCSRLDRFYRIREQLENTGITLLEDDIRPAERYLMERFIGAGMRVDLMPAQYQSQTTVENCAIAADDYRPALRLLSLDIETAVGHPELYSIGLAMAGVERVLMKGVGQDTELIRYLPDEASLIEALNDAVDQLDPDLVVGWNLIQFDLAYLQATAERARRTLRLGRGGSRLRMRKRNNGNWGAEAPGRVFVDGIEAMRGATYHFESYSLESVSQALLGRGKQIDQQSDKVTEIMRLYREDQAALAAYNIEDCRLVLDIFDVAGLTDYLVERAALTGLTMERIGGSAAAFDHLYLPRLHRQGFVAPAYASGSRGLDSPGGYVMDSRPGLFDHVLVLDFKSLYPSIIRTFLIDPVGLQRGLMQPEAESVPGFNGARFDRKTPILPELLAQLWQARDQAKQGGHKALSTAIKIIMNAFYGVLGSPQCRFFDQRLSGSITLRGHQVLTESGRFVEQQGYTVIYGDTDSLFVWLRRTVTDEQADEIGNDLAQQLNGWWQQRLHDEFALHSFLEIEFETHYRRFLMPTIRGSDKGSKKRYAGVIGSKEEPQLVFKGLEAVRSDWTPLAREFQQTLYRCVFLNQPYEQLVISTVKQLLAGELDDKLVYRKRLRRPLADYVRNQPPHVQAAKKAVQQDQAATGGRRGERIAYLITINGPEPLAYRRSPIDYQHYLDKQLAPIADGILPFVGSSFAKLTGQQGELF